MGQQWGKNGTKAGQKKWQKRGQTEITFNWLYILIAGGLILLFFVGIVVKQQARSETQLSFDVVRILESIIKGASISEKTKNSIDISGLKDYTLYFSCEEGVSKYGLEGTSAQVEDVVQPVFSPTRIKAPRLNLWSIPYKLPYKTIDFLFVTSSTTKYFFVGQDENFVNEFFSQTEKELSGKKEVLFEIKRDFVTSVDVIDPEKYFHIRIVDVGGNTIKAGDSVPQKLRSLEDGQVTAVSFTAGNTADFFQKAGDTWMKRNKQPIYLISLGGERDAAKYAAIFAENEELYTCNMKKAFRRLQYVSEVYLEKLQEMEAYYDTPLRQVNYPDCIGNIKLFPTNLVERLELFQNKIAARAATYPEATASCTELRPLALTIQELNQELARNCATLY